MVLVLGKASLQWKKVPSTNISLQGSWEGKPLELCSWPTATVRSLRIGRDRDRYIAGHAHVHGNAEMARISQVSSKLRKTTSRCDLQLNSWTLSWSGSRSPKIDQNWGSKSISSTLRLRCDPARTGNAVHAIAASWLMQIRRRWHSISWHPPLAWPAAGFIVVSSVQGKVC